MNPHIPLDGDDWLLKGFIGEDWVWRNAEKPDSRDTRFWLPATVPGSVHHDLWRSGEIPDPYFERNSLLMEWVPGRAWLYKKRFKRVQLRFERVDYEARVFLNGQPLGAHRGMYTPVAFEVGDLLAYGEDNLVAVVIEPAPHEEPQVGKTSRVRTHKSCMTYWWDFCPPMIHLGVWDRSRCSSPAPYASKISSSARSSSTTCVRPPSPFPSASPHRMLPASRSKRRSSSRARSLPCAVLHTRSSLARPDWRSRLP